MQDATAKRRRAVNLSVDAALLDEAKAAGKNLSSILENALAAELSEHHWQEWRRQNRKAIEDSNAEIEKNGNWYTPDWLR